MTEHEAIEWKKAFRRTYKRMSKEVDIDTACNMVIETIEKQIPEKPIKIRTSCKRFYYACPICENRQDRQVKRCYECGQALDWSEE